MGKQTETKQLLLLGKKNNSYIWNSKYIEKNKTESNLYLFQTLEIENFLKKFLNHYNLELYRYNINFSESVIKIVISYFKTAKIIRSITKINLNQKIRLVNNKRNVKKSLFKKNLLNKFTKRINKIETKNKHIVFNQYYNFYYKYLEPLIFFNNKIKNKFTFNLEKKLSLIKLKYLVSQYSKTFLSKKKLKFNFKYLSKHNIITFINFKKFQKILLFQYNTILRKLFLVYSKYKKILQNFLLKKIMLKNSRLKLLKDYKIYKKLETNKTLQTLKHNSFINQFNESLNIFTKNKFINILIFQQINKNILFNLTYRQLQSLKKIIIQLRQFKNVSFFKEGLNTILVSLINPKEINLLANFISLQLKLLKRHNFFFKFLSKTLSLGLKNKFSKIKSIKILIKGRLNRRFRTRKKVLFINKYMSLMTINSSINCTYSTSYSLKGVIGVKLWTNTY